MDKLTICFAVIELGADVGGAERQLVVELRGLDRSRFHPILVMERAGGALEQEVRSLGIPVHIIPRRANDGLGYRWNVHPRPAPERAALAQRLAGNLK